MKLLFKQIAACPACHASLVWDTDFVRCEGEGCGRRFEMAGNVPVMDLREDVGAIATSAPAVNHSRFRVFLSTVLSSTNSTYKTKEGSRRQQRFIDGLGPDAVILNVGSGTDDYGPRVVNMDIDAFQNVDVVGRSEWLPVQSESVDGLITTGVLEHVGDLGATLREIDRVMRPGAQVFHEVPFIQGFHGTIDYRRFTYQGTRDLVEHYELIDEGVAVGPSSALVWVLSQWLGMLFSFGNQRVYFIAARLFLKLTSPLRFFDSMLESIPEARMGACSLFVHARKSLTNGSA